MHEGNPVLNIQIGGNGASTARLYIFVECALFLQSLFQQNKTNVLFREIARLIARNSLMHCFVKIYCITCITLNYCLTEILPTI